METDDEFGWMVTDGNGPVGEQPAFGPMSKDDALAMEARGREHVPPYAYWAHPIHSR